MTQDGMINYVIIQLDADRLQDCSEAGLEELKAAFNFSLLLELIAITNCHY